MKYLLIIVLVILIIYIVYKFFAPYFVRIDNAFYVSGSMGTGKDVLSHGYALKRYKVALRSYKLKKFFNDLFNRFRKVGKKKVFTVEKPEFYSTVPVLISYGFGKKKIISKPVTLDIVLLRKRIPHKSVVYISDINRMINQWSYKNDNVIDNIAEFISMFRQYTKGGYFIANSQGSFQVAKEIRGVFGKIRNNLNFKRFLFFYRIEGRTITVSEDVLNVEQGDADNRFNGNVTYVYGFLNPFIRRYDTYAYYGRVYNMSIEKVKEYEKANTNYFLDIPKEKINSLVYSEDNDYSVYFKLDKLKMVLYLFGFTVLGLLFGLIFNSFIPFGILYFIYALMFFDALK